MQSTPWASHHHGNSFKDIINPLLSSPGGLFFSSTFEEGLNRDRGGLFNLTKCINRSKVSQGRTCVTGRYTAFSNNKKMVTILHRDLEHKVEKVRSAHEVGGHVAEDQKQYEFPAWMNHNWSVHVNCLWRIRMEGGGEGGDLITFLWPLKGGAY